MTSPITVRPFTWDDLSSWTKLYNAAYGTADTGLELDRASMRCLLSQPGLDPERDCFIAHDSGSDVGLAIEWPELPVRRAVIELGVPDSASAQATAPALIEASVARAQQLAVTVVHIQVESNNEPMKLLLREFGFHPVRRYATMRWQRDSLEQPTLPPGFTLRTFRADRDIRALTDIQNAAFGDSWGFSPNTAEQIESRVAARSTTPEGIIFVMHGRDVAAYNWTVRPAGPGGVLGRIAMTGVHPDYQGRGLSRPTVLAGMQWLNSQGVSTIELEMDSSNLSAARVYESLGFERVSSTVWYELEVSD